MVVSIVTVALYGRFLDRAVYALDLATGAGMLDLGQPMFDPVSWHRISNIPRREDELDRIVGEHSVDLVGDGRDQSFEKGRG